MSKRKFSSSTHKFDEVGHVLSSKFDCKGWLKKHFLCSGWTVWVQCRQFRPVRLCFCCTLRHHCCSFSLALEPVCWKLRQFGGDSLFANGRPNERINQRTRCGRQSNIFRCHSPCFLNYLAVNLQQDCSHLRISPQAGCLNEEKHLGNEFWIYMFFWISGLFL